MVAHAPLEVKQAVHEKLCELIKCGASVSEACKQVGIDRKTFYNWCEDNVFGPQIARARATGCDARCDELVDMADEANDDNWQAVRLRIWTRQWVMGKLAPRKYGESTQLALPAGTDGELIFRWKSANETEPKPVLPVNELRQLRQPSDQENSATP